MNHTEAIKQLIEGIPGKTLAAKLRTIMPEIDRRIREGVQHDEILAALNQNGFDLNLNTFRSNLYRYRKKMRSEPKSPAKETDANGNLQQTAPVSVDESQAKENLSNTEQLEQIFSDENRGGLGDKYLKKQSQLFGKNRSK